MRVTLARRYKGQSIKGWFMSEKHDGFRALWTGTELVSRKGLKFNAPDWFVADLPAGVMLDGELHAGRGGFNKVLSIVQKKTPVDAEWELIKFSVFDAPGGKGEFTDRLEYAGELIEDSKVAEAVRHYQCLGYLHMVFFFLAMVRAGAEGAMLRRSTNEYEQYRSDNLLKLKPYIYVDATLLSLVGWLVSKLKLK